MQLGIRLHDIEKGTMEHRLGVAHEQGFACGHLALSKMISEYSVDNSALTPGFAMYIKKLFQKNELDIAVLGCYLNLGNPNAESLKKITEKYMAHIRFASTLGVGVLGTETGAVNEKYATEEANFTEEALEVFIKNLRPIVEYAEKMGVIVAIEPVCRHIVCNPKRARKVLDTINSPNLQIIFDPVNLIETWNYERREEIFKEAIELLGKDIAVVHIKDFVIEDGKMISVAAGIGMMDYTQIVKFIKEQKPYIHVTLENTVPENAVEARKYFQGLWDEA